MYTLLTKNILNEVKHTYNDHWNFEFINSENFITTLKCYVT